MEHRMDIRFPLKLRVRLITNEKELDGETINLSFEGACIRIDSLHDFSTLPPRQPVRVELNPGSDALELPAMVIRRDVHRVGVLFGRYSPESEERLSALLTSYVDSHGERLFG